MIAAIRGPASWLPKWIQLRTRATDRNGVLGGVGTQLQDRMIEEASQPIPQRQGVVAGFGQSPLWQSLAASGFDLALDRFQDRSCPLLPQPIALGHRYIPLSGLWVDGAAFIGG